MAIPGLGTIAGALRRRWKLLTVLGALFVTYTAAGFFLVPYLARHYIQQYVEKDLGRHVSIGDLTFNPFSLTVEVRNFALTEADGSPIASFDLFRVNAEFRSLVYRAWTFKEIRLDKPSLRVLVNADGTLNLAKLKPAATEPALAPEPAGPAAIPALRVATFAVHEGRIAVEDDSRGQPFSTTLTPIEFTLNDFPTAPDFQNAYNFEGSTLAGERLTWNGQFTVQPLGSTGRFAVAGLKAATIASYLKDALPVELASGSLDLGGEYRLAIADPLGLTVTLPSVKLHDFAIAPKGANGGMPWIAVPELDVSGIAFSLADRKLGVERVDVSDAKVSVWREADGSLNVMKLMPPQAPAANVTASAPAAVPQTPSAPAFDISVATIALRGASVDVEDRSVRPSVKFSLAPIALTVSGYSSAPGNKLAIDASVGVNGKGTVAAKGDLVAAPLAANFDIDAANIALPAIQPYLAQSTGLVLLSGDVSAKTKIAYAAEPAKGQPGLKVAGEVSVGNLVTQDSALHQDFVKWRQLRLAGIDYQQGPDRLSIDRIEAHEPYGRVVISADQMLNVVAVLNPPGKTPPAQPAKEAAPAPKPAPAKAQNTPMPMRIGTIVVDNGSANFADFSIEPNFASAIQSLNGTVTGLSSAPNSRATVKLDGNVDRFAPVDISGTLNVLSAAVYTDIALNFRNMELTTFNPYSGKYAGYNISKGKLTTELRYKVENRKLDAQHHIVLDQLEFGAATNSKDAVPLPIRLAVALLKDRNGVIDLNLPVGGSLDDPSFRVGPIIWQVFVGLVTKIVTAPFALIGSLFGGGEDLAYVDFAAGSPMLAPAETGKLDKVAKALAERPELKLDIPLQTLSPADDAALQEAAFEKAVADATVPGMMAGPETRLAALAKLYQEQLGMAPVYPVSENPADILKNNIAFLEQALRPKYVAAPAAREALARARADAVQAAVLANKEIMPERVFLVERTSAKPADGGGVRMELALQ